MAANGGKLPDLAAPNGDLSPPTMVPPPDSEMPQPSALRNLMQEEMDSPSAAQEEGTGGRPADSGLGGTAYIPGKMFLLNDENVEALRRGFEAMDIDGSGTLDFFELQNLWAAVFTERTPEEVKRITEHIFPDIDTDGDEEITFDELIAYLKGQATLDGGLEIMFGMSETRKDPTSLREYVWAVVDQGTGELYMSARIRAWSLYFALSMQAVILVAVVLMIVESLPSMTDSTGELGTDETFIVESCCIGLFTLEFLSRLATTPSILALFRAGFTWIDLFSILPYYLDLAGTSSGAADSLPVLRVLRMGRLVRVLRILKLGKNAEGVQLMVVAVGRARLALSWAMLLITLAVTTYASIMWFVERIDANFDPVGSNLCMGSPPCGVWVRAANSKYADAGSPITFQSIPDAMWWALVTLTTVGYGDTYPVTDGGKCVAALTMGTGILVMAYPVTILCTHFSEAQREFDEEKTKQRRRMAFKHRLKTDPNIQVRAQVNKMDLSNPSAQGPRKLSIVQWTESPKHGAGSPLGQPRRRSNTGNTSHVGHVLGSPGGTGISSRQGSIRSPTMAQQTKFNTVSSPHGQHEQDGRATTTTTGRAMTASSTRATTGSGLPRDVSKSSTGWFTSSSNQPTAGKNLPPLVRIERLLEQQSRYVRDNLQRVEEKLDALRSDVAHIAARVDGVDSRLDCAARSQGWSVPELPPAPPPCPPRADGPASAMPSPPPALSPAPASPPPLVPGGGALALAGAPGGGTPAAPPGNPLTAGGGATAAHLTAPTISAFGAAATTGTTGAASASASAEPSGNPSGLSVGSEAPLHVPPPPLSSQPAEAAAVQLGFGDPACDTRMDAAQVDPAGGAGGQPAPARAAFPAPAGGGSPLAAADRGGSPSFGSSPGTSGRRRRRRQEREAGAAAGSGPI